MSSLTSKILSGAKSLILVLVLLALLTFSYKYVMRLVKPRSKPSPQIVKDFDPADQISFVPKVGIVTDLTSDRTVDALLSGQFGPIVLVFVADWCGHCKNIAAAYEAAAASSEVPFVRVKGEFAPVSSNKYGIAGYPTVLGFASVGGPPRRFASQRTTESLLQFAVGLRGSVVELAQQTMQPVVQAPLPVVQPTVQASQPMVQPMVQIVQPKLVPELPMASTVEVLSKD